MSDDDYVNWIQTKIETCGIIHFIYFRFFESEAFCTFCQSSSRTLHTHTRYIYYVYIYVCVCVIYIYYWSYGLDVFDIILVKQTCTVVNIVIGIVSIFINISFCYFDHTLSVKNACTDGICLLSTPDTNSTII